MRWLKSSDKRRLTESQAEPHPAKAAASRTANAPSGVESRAGTVSAADPAGCSTDGPSGGHDVPSDAACTSLAATAASASDLSHQGAECAVQPGTESKPSQAITGLGSAHVRLKAPEPAAVLSVDESQPREAICGVRGIWVSMEARRKGIASQLLDAARHAPSVSCAWDVCEMQIVHRATQ